MVGRLGTGNTRRRQKERVTSEIPKVAGAGMNRDNVGNATLHNILKQK